MTYMKCHLSERVKISSPMVSLIMGVYNGDKYLKESIGSILNQSFRDFEFIIINDGSTDKTGEILEGYNDERLTIIKQEENKGLTFSLNIAIDYMRGRYIARMDADDISLPERLEKQVQFLEDYSEYGLVGVTDEVIDKNGKTIGIEPRLLEDKEIKKGLILGNQFCHGSVMFRREIIEKIGKYDYSLRYSQDYEFWLRVSRIYKIANLPDILYRRRETQGNITSLFGKKQRDYANMIRDFNLKEIIREERHKTVFPEYYKYQPDTGKELFARDKHYIQRKKYFSKVCRAIGLKYLMLGEIKEARDEFLSAFRLSNINLLALILWGYTFLNKYSVKGLKMLYFIRDKISNGQ
ncbi:MAG: glycosyltransferase family 2 protein [Nitrospirota bacterium]